MLLFDCLLSAAAFALQGVHLFRLPISSAVRLLPHILPPFSFIVHVVVTGLLSARTTPVEGMGGASQLERWAVVMSKIVPVCWSVIWSV